MRLVRGKRQVVGILAAAVLFYITFAVTSAGRFGMPSGALMTYVFVVPPFLMAIGLAIAAFFTHRTLRHLYLLLNFIWMILGVVWVGRELLVGVQGHWIAIDAFGLLIAAGICWVFCYSKTARLFLDEQELLVRRD